MKLGTYTFNHGKQDQRSVEEKIDLFQKIGFDFVALDYANLVEGVRHCQKIGFPVENVHLLSRDTSLIWLEDERGDAIMNRYCEQIERCVEHGVMTGIAHVTYGSEIAPPGEAGYRRYAKIVECAEKHNFNLCVENTRASEHLVYVMDRFKSPNVYFCYDSGHDIGMAHNTKYYNKFLSSYGDRLGAVHIHDSIKDFDLHVIPFDGAIDWDFVSKELAKTKYGAEKLCAEPGGLIHAIKEGKTADELRATYADMAIANDESLVRFYDGYYTVYEELSMEEYLERYLKGLKKLGAMIESANK